MSDAMTFGKTVGTLGHGRLQGRVVIVMGNQSPEESATMLVWDARDWPGSPPRFTPPTPGESDLKEQSELYCENHDALERLVRIALAVDLLCLGTAQCLGVARSGFTAQVRRGDEDEWMNAILDAQAAACRS